MILLLILGLVAIISPTQGINGDVYNSLKTGSVLGENMVVNVTYVGQDVFDTPTTPAPTWGSYDLSVSKVVLPLEGEVNEYTLSYDLAFWAEFDAVTPITVEYDGIVSTNHIINNNSIVFRTPTSIDGSDLNITTEIVEKEITIAIEKSGATGYVNDVNNNTKNIKIAKLGYYMPLKLEAESIWASSFAYWEFEGNFYSSDDIIDITINDKKTFSNSSKLTAYFIDKEFKSDTDDVLIKNYQFYGKKDNYKSNGIVGSSNISGYQKAGSSLSFDINPTDATINTLDYVELIEKSPLGATINTITIYNGQFDFTIPSDIASGNYYELNSYFCNRSDKQDVFLVELNKNYRIAGESLLSYKGYKAESLYCLENDTINVSSIESVGFEFDEYFSTGRSLVNSKAKTFDIGITQDTIFTANYKFSAEYKEDFEGYNSDKLQSSMSYGKWESDTLYKNGWDKAVIAGQNAIYFGLPTAYNVGEVRHYSMDSTLTSPELDLVENIEKYKFSFDYYTIADSDFANELSVFVSTDGVEYEELLGMSVSNTSGMFKTVTADILYDVKFIRFAVKVYYQEGLDRGIYLDNIKIESRQTATEKPEFLLNKGNLNFDYNGKPQSPDVSVVSSDSSYKYSYAVRPSLSGAVPSDVGSYVCSVVIFNAKNQIVEVKEFDYFINKVDLFLDTDDIVKEDTYFSTNQYLVFNELSVSSADGVEVNDYDSIIIELEETDLTYLETNVVTSLGRVLTVKNSNNFSYRARFLVNGGKNYNDFTTDYIDINSGENDESLLKIDTVQSSIYDGNTPQLEYEFYKKLGSIDSVRFVFTQNNIEVENPKNVGVYQVEVYYGEQSYLVEHTILPRVISQATYTGGSLDKFYDGTEKLFYNYTLSDTINSEELELSQVVAGEDVSLVAKKGVYARSIGFTRLKLSDLSLTGADAKNYVLANDFDGDESFDCEIKPIELQYNNNVDSDGNTIITFIDSVFNGGFIAEYDVARIKGLYGELENAPLSFYGMAEGEKLTLDKIIALYLDCYAGSDKLIELKINDKTMLDRYQVNINSLVVGLRANIEKMSIDLINAGNITANDKDYDKTNKADVNIAKGAYQNSVNSVMLDAINAGRIGIGYNQAIYSQSDVGSDLPISITGIYFKCYDPNIQSLVNSYHIEDYNVLFNSSLLAGNINVKNINLKNQNLSIINNESVPAIETEVTGLGTDYFAYTTSSDADNDTNRVDIDNTSVGTYYLVVRIIGEGSGNYSLINSRVILNIISNYSIEFFVFDGEEYVKLTESSYNVMLNGYVSIKAFTMSGENVVEKPTIVTLNNILYLENRGDKYFAKAVGSLVMTAKNDVQSKAIGINVVDEKVINATYGQTDEYFYQDKLPKITASADIDSTPINGRFLEPDDIILAGEKTYKYTFVPTPSASLIGEYLVDVDILGAKLDLKLDFDSINKGYYENINFLDIAIASVYRDNVFVKMINNTDLNAISLSYTTSEDITEWLPNTYTKDLTGDNKLLVFEENENYRISFIDPTITIVVSKNIIDIKMNNFTKEYGADILSDEELKGEEYLIFDGIYKEEDKIGILEKLNILVQAEKYSVLGEYLVVLINEAYDYNDRYEINIANGYMSIVKALINISGVATESVYGKPLNNIGYELKNSLGETINIPSADKLELESKININADVSSLSSVGKYLINVDFNGTMDNYNVIINSDLVYYTIAPATINIEELKIVFRDKTVVYNGEKHSLAVDYNKENLSDLVVSYSSEYFINAGVYEITAYISRPNYNQTAITANLTIQLQKLVSTSEVYELEISLTSADKGFSPSLAMVMTPIKNGDFYTKVLTELNKTDISEEVVWGAFTLVTYDNGEEFSMQDTVVKLRLKIKDVENLNSLRVVVFKDNEFVEMKYIVDGEYIEFVTNNFTNLAIYENREIFTHDTADLIIVIVIVVVVFIVLSSIVIKSTKKGMKREKRSRRRHHKYL